MIRGVKEAWLRLPGVGKRTALVAEQLGFDQSVRNRGAVHINEGAVGTGAAAVDQPGEHALARAGFALKQYWWEPVRALLSGEQLLGLLADCCDCATHPKQLVRRDHSAVSYIRTPPPATGGFSPLLVRSMSLSYCFRECGLLARALRREAWAKDSRDLPRSREFEDTRSGAAGCCLSGRNGSRTGLKILDE